MRRFFHYPLPATGNTVHLDEQASHHLLRVVGIAVNEEVVLFDGQGRSCHAVLKGVEKGIAVLEIKNEIKSASEKTEEYWLLVSLVRPNPFSTVLRMATELGVHHIVPVLSSRSIQRAGKIERWKKIVLSSAQQCGRSDVPTVYDVHSLENALDLIEHVDQKWLFHPHDSIEVNSDIKTSGSQAILVGPEGGFTESELLLAKEKRCVQKTLGGLMFRTDTAVAVVLSYVRFGTRST
jgi:RNA methyltransferase, RsmE family